MAEEIDNRVATLNAHHILRRAARDESRRSERRNGDEGRDRPAGSAGRPSKV